MLAWPFGLVLCSAALQRAIAFAAGGSNILAVARGHVSREEPSLIGRDAGTVDAAEFAHGHTVVFGLEVEFEDIALLGRRLIRVEFQVRRGSDLDRIGQNSAGGDGEQGGDEPHLDIDGIATRWMIDNRLRWAGTGFAGCAVKLGCGEKREDLLRTVATEFGILLALKMARWGYFSGK